MNAITIPKKLIGQDDLVIIPRKEYESFLQWQKEIKYFNPTSAQTKALRKAEKEYEKGKCLTLNELKQKLGIKN